MLKPSRSDENSPNQLSISGNDPANQKKYTSHAASPNANRMLAPAMDRPPLRMAVSS